MKKGEIDGVFLLAIMMGVLGGLLGSILDRHFSHYGFPYELIVAVLFFGIMWPLVNKFNKSNPPDS